MSGMSSNKTALRPNFDTLAQCGDSQFSRLQHWDSQLKSSLEIGLEIQACKVAELVSEYETQTFQVLESELEQTIRHSKSRNWNRNQNLLLLEFFLNCNHCFAPSAFFTQIKPFSNIWNQNINAKALVSRLVIVLELELSSKRVQSRNRNRVLSQSRDRSQNRIADMDKLRSGTKFLDQTVSELESKKQELGTSGLGCPKIHTIWKITPTRGFLNILTQKV